MHTFRIVKERFGWAVRLGDRMSTPFWFQAPAIREAQRLSEALRRHGLVAEVVIEEEPNETTIDPASREDPGDGRGDHPGVDGRLA